MAEPRPERCATCRCWDGPADGDPEDEGICRRHALRPATPAGDDAGPCGLFPVWPLTLGSEWCVEGWRPKRGAAPTTP